MTIWAPFLQSMCTFCFCINLWKLRGTELVSLQVELNLVKLNLMKQEINTSFIMSESDLQRKQQEKKKKAFWLRFLYNWGDVGLL